MNSYRIAIIEKLISDFSSNTENSLEYAQQQEVEVFQQVDCAILFDSSPKDVEEVKKVDHLKKKWIKLVENLVRSKHQTNKVIGLALLQATILKIDQQTLTKQYSKWSELLLEVIKVF